MPEQTHSGNHSLRLFTFCLHLAERTGCSQDETLGLAVSRCKIAQFRVQAIIRSDAARRLPYRRSKSPRIRPMTAQQPDKPGPPDAPVSLDDLAERLYPELHRLARMQLRRLRPGQTLNTTALVHEAYVKLMGSAGFADRGHFLAASARAMRHILVNAARDRLADKRGGGAALIPLDEVQVADERAHCNEVLAVGQALERLRELDERLCRVVECRFYAGMTEEETAVALNVSDRTVRRDWLRARAWLKSDMGRLGIEQTDDA